MNETAERIRQWGLRFESKLEASLTSVAGTPDLLHQAMKYSVLAGGKRIRPMLVYASGEALGLDLGKLDGIACAVEIIHTYSLIHDDLPAMDDDDFRRGNPTCHRAFDEATAILAGDALQALAFEILASDPSLSELPDTQIKVIRDIARACGSSGMAGGQALDLAAVGNSLSHEELSHMHSMKTGALIKASATAVALFAGTKPELFEKLENFGADIGLAFQIHDDILDVTGTQEKTGKSTQKDALQEKPTFPGILGLEAPRAQAQTLKNCALAELEGFPGNCDALEWLATFAVDRDN
jgi:farnesyl diphosphate synthase